MNKNFITSQPQDSLVKKLIAYYYFHKNETENHREKFIYYPNYQNALTIYKQSNVKYHNNSSFAFPDKKTPFYIAFSGVENNPRVAEIKAPFNKIGVVFKPLGLNQLVKGQLASYIGSTSDKRFSYFDEDIFPTCKELYSSEKIDDKVELLDKYFSKHYLGFSESHLIKAVFLLTEAQENINVQELALKLGIHRKTLLRIFQKHLNCTVKDYISIVKFRRALNDYQNADEKPQLIHLAYENNYYDQSEFINHFKKTTGFNPKKLLKNLEHLGNEDTFFTFLDSE